MTLPSGNSIPTYFTIFPFSITNIAHFSLPNSIPISSLKTRIVCTNESNPFSLRLYNFKSSINKRLSIFSLLSERVGISLYCARSTKITMTLFRFLFTYFIFKIIKSEGTTFHMFQVGSRAIAHEENCPPILIVTLTLTRGQFSSWAIMWTPFEAN